VIGYDFPDNFFDGMESLFLPLLHFIPYWLCILILTFIITQMCFQVSIWTKAIVKQRHLGILFLDLVDTLQRLLKQEDLPRISHVFDPHGLDSVQEGLILLKSIKLWVVSLKDVPS
jgi:hypothetical protein